MLTAGFELACERLRNSSLDGPPIGLNPIAEVRLTDVAIRATELEQGRGHRSPADPPITTGAIYPIWEDQAAYQNELAIHIAHLHAERRAQLEHDMVLAFADNAATLSAATKAAGKVLYRGLVGDPTFPLTISLVAATGDPRIREAMLHNTTENHTIVPVMDMTVKLRGARVVEPFSTESLYRCFRALIDGLLVQRMLDPDYFAALDEKLASGSFGEQGDAQEEAWTLLSRATHALILGFTEPDRG
ncbi:MAG: hypothetical protein HKN26_09135 [Acidimicrobiales bacterium]|nr:hypothetical protein [Acidimicrobiales bacterium]